MKPRIVKFSAMLAVVVAVLLFTAPQAKADPILSYTHTDGAVFTLEGSNVGNLYTFTLTADFTSVDPLSAAIGDYAMLYSVKSQPNSTDYALGTIQMAPGDDSNWQLVQNDSSSNGCKVNNPTDYEWCFEVKHDSSIDPTDATMPIGPQIQVGTVLTFQHTMTLVSGTPNFEDPWPFKFTTTTGIYEPHQSDPDKDAWEFGGYQISAELSPTRVPEPSSLTLLGLGLAGALIARRRTGQSR